MTLELRFHQLAYVVSDLDAAVRHWSDVLGIGPWSVWTMTGDRIHDTRWRGQPAEFGIRHALAWAGEQQFELVEPLHGPGIFPEQLVAGGGDGASHIGAVVPDHEAAIAELIGRGFEVLQSARFGASADGRFAYLSHPHLPTIVELIRPPSERFAPDYVYPEADR
jgi:catechol 2,3-dioxygenase-like lactoylglutathione lyase family enzyme